MRVTRPAARWAIALGVVAALVLPAGPALADDVRDDQWWVQSLDLTAAHKITQGEGITVAVVDSGVDAGHPDLKGNVLPGTDFFNQKTKGQQDRLGHGTAMASLIAGHGHGPGNRDGVIGIAPKAKILPVTVRAKNGVIPAKAIAAGIYYAIDKGADVINVSLSSPEDSDLDAAVEKAYQKNILVIAGVGNRQDVIIGALAKNPPAVAVTVLNKKGGLGKEHITATQTVIAAPGDDLVQAKPGGGYTTASGSSGATAIVSGSVALIRAAHPSSGSFEQLGQLLETTRDAGEPGKDENYGWGALDLMNALTGKPDGRAAKKSTAPTEPSVPYYAQVNQNPDDWQVVAIVVGFWLAILLVIGGLIFLLVRRRRRKRRAKEAAAAVPVGVGGPPPTDDSAWQRP